MSKERAGGKFFLGKGGLVGWQSKQLLDIVYNFSLRRAVDGILIIFTRILTIDRCYYFFHGIFLVSLCFDLDFIARSFA